MPDPIFDSALLSMCMTWRHDFGLLDREEQMVIKRELLGVYEHHVKPAIEHAERAETALRSIRFVARTPEEAPSQEAAFELIERCVDEVVGKTNPNLPPSASWGHIPDATKMVGEAVSKMETTERCDTCQHDPETCDRAECPAWGKSEEAKERVLIREANRPLTDEEHAIVDAGYERGKRILAEVRNDERGQRLVELIKKADDLAETAANVCDDCDGECADCVFCNVRVFAREYREQRAALADMEQKP